MSNFSRGERNPVEYLTFLNNECNKKEQDIKEKESYLNTINIGLTNISKILLDKKSELELMVKDLTSKISIKTESINALDIKIEELNKSKLSLENSNFILVNDKIELETTITKLQVNKQKIDKELVLSTEKHNSLSIENDNLSSEISELKLLLNTKGKDIANLITNTNLEQKKLDSIIVKQHNQTLTNKSEMDIIYKKREDLKLENKAIEKREQAINLFELEKGSFMEDINITMTNFDKRESDIISQEQELVRKEEELISRERENFLKGEESDVRERMLTLKIKKYKLNEK